jgi:hypothetical protein
LLIEHIRNVEPAVDPVVIDSWLESDKSWFKRLPENYNSRGPNIIIIDEGQSTYWDNGFWHSFLKPIINDATPNRVILFASYGSPRGGFAIGRTIAIIPDKNRVSLQPVDHGDQIPPAGLFFTTGNSPIWSRGHIHRDFSNKTFSIMCSVSPLVMQTR